MNFENNQKRIFN